MQKYTFPICSKRLQFELLVVGKKLKQNFDPGMASSEPTRQLLQKFQFQVELQEKEMKQASLDSVA
jgi:hypothetical protein